MLRGKVSCHLRENRGLWLRRCRLSKFCSTFVIGEFSKNFRILQTQTLWTNQFSHNILYTEQIMPTCKFQHASLCFSQCKGHRHCGSKKYKQGHHKHATLRYKVVCTGKIIHKLQGNSRSSHLHFTPQNTK